MHRVPVPESVVLSMFSVCILFEWWRFGALLLIMFYGMFRPVEPLTAVRANLVLPSDLLKEACERFYLRILKPKTGGRGGAREQYGTIEISWVCNFVSAVFSGRPRSERLWPASAVAFRRRWDRLLSVLGIPSRLYTPGGLRGGGAVRHFELHRDLPRLMWDMRLQNVTTLNHYLQEVVSSTSICSIPFASRSKLTFFQNAAQPLAEAAGILLKSKCDKSFRKLLATLTFET